VRAIARAKACIYLPFNSIKKFNNNYHKRYMAADISLYLEVYTTILHNGLQEHEILGLLEVITSYLAMIGDISYIFFILVRRKRNIAASVII
jgi:hypothetical protein